VSPSIIRVTLASKSWVELGEVDSDSCVLIDEGAGVMVGMGVGDGVVMGVDEGKGMEVAVVSTTGVGDAVVVAVLAGDVTSSCVGGVPPAFTQPVGTKRQTMHNKKAGERTPAPRYPGLGKGFAVWEEAT
jgi:hypothetical protein